MIMRSLVVNCKAYTEGIDRAVAIASEMYGISKRYSDVDFIVAAPYTLLRDVSRLTKTLAQSMDTIEPGAFTGHVSWYELKKAGAVGTLINHSEKRISIREVEKAVNICRDNGLLSYVCASNLREVKKFVKFNPYAIAYEPPELIGGEVSVSKAKPKVVKQFTDIVRSKANSLALVGAGIKTPEDISKSVALGSDGILVASGIIKVENWEETIYNFCDALS